MTDNSVPVNRGDATSSSLLLRVKAQEPAAWERLVHLYTPLVYNWCRRTGMQEADALDLGQDVFQSVWCKIPAFHRDRPGDTFRGWLWTVVQHKIIDFHRRKQVEAVPQGGRDEPTQPYIAPPLPEPDDEENKEETTLLCRRALALIRAEFEEHTWQAFEAVVMLSRKAADVAAELGISVNAVYLAKSRVLQRLREEFAELIEM